MANKRSSNTDKQWARRDELRDKFFSGFHPHDAFEMRLTPQEVEELIEVMDAIYEERNDEARALLKEVAALRFVLDDLKTQFPIIEQYMKAVNERAKHYETVTKAVQP